MEKLMSPEDVRKVHYIENLPENDTTSVALGTIADEEKEARIALRKADMRILPLLTVLYVFSFMDRSNIGNAKVAGMNKDLNLTGTQYNLALTVFFFPYSLLEVPSNVILKLTRPSRWIAALVISWGTVLALQGIVKNYEQLIVTRVFLGITEAGFFPAATYLLTTWYCRWEYQTRVAIFFSAASLAGGFSGLLAYGIQHMDGVAGLGGWRWIFILEGIMTVLIGTILPWTLPDSPAVAKFLTPGEKELIHQRLQRDSGTSEGKVATEEAFQWRYLRAALLDYKIYLGIIMFWGNTICIYAFSFAMPTIIQQLGYSAANAQLLTIPVYFVGALATYLFARLADRKKTRWPFVVIPFCISAVGFIGLLSIPHPNFPGLTYAMLFFVPSGLYPAVIGCISWISNNLAPTWKRAVGMALLMSIGNLGGAVGANIFLESQAPRYPLGYGLSLAVVCAGVGAAMILRGVVTRINAARQAMSDDEIRAKYSHDQLLQMGDSSPFYRYVK
ncbi:unnamed protein product [Clonostachys chloroleuca]|uniref:Major facilitator superfamily (MFS) profile domain-containing protein n=1 Tax=Clonostachys chloroleuca TaxID=1926264 RepID=A0AA35Q7R3_9HYPO|nr:unnamed protein product [Clonostachys chloroleuca]